MLLTRNINKKLRYYPYIYVAIMQNPEKQYFLKQNPNTHALKIKKKKRISRKQKRGLRVSLVLAF